MDIGALTACRHNVLKNIMPTTRLFKITTKLAIAICALFDKMASQQRDLRDSATRRCCK
jgi:predicted neutral ceramidase superfamily lipid hydrolase